MSVRRGVVIALLAVLSALAGAARAAAPPESLEWTRYQSPNFTFYSSAPPRRTEDYIVRLERFREVLDTIFPNLETASPVETTVFVFRDKTAMEPFVPRYHGKAVQIDGAFFRSRDANFVIVDGSGTDDHMPTVYHEYMHYFTMRNLPPLPPWFSEGIAECYETFRTDGKTAEIGRAKADHILYLRQVPFMPLEQLFAIRQDSPEYNEGDRRSVFYAESWALVHYLLWDTTQHRQKVVQFLERLGAGQTHQDAFAGAFGTGPAALEAELRRNLQRGTYLKSVVTLKGPPLEASIRRSGVSKPEILARFGDFLAHSPGERSAEAEQYLRAALETEPDQAVALRGLALVRRDEGKNDEAKSLLEKRVAADPRDGMAAWFLGELLMEEADTIPRARTLLLGAATARPDVPEIAVSYGRSVLAGPQPPAADRDRAIGLLNSAREKLRYRPDIIATQAVLLAAQGNFPAAESLVTRALPVLGDPRALEWAQSTLEQYRRFAKEKEAYEKRAAAAAAPEVVEGSAAAPGAAGPGTAWPEGFTPPEKTEELPPEDPRALAAQASADDYNRDVAAFNKGIELANRRDYAGAVALLERLEKTTRFTDIRDRLKPLLADLRKRATGK